MSIDMSLDADSLFVLISYIEALFSPRSLASSRYSVIYKTWSEICIIAAKPICPRAQRASVVVHFNVKSVRIGDWCCQLLLWPISAFRSTTCGHEANWCPGLSFKGRHGIGFDCAVLVSINIFFSSLLASG